MMKRAHLFDADFVINEEALKSELVKVFVFFNFIAS